MKLEEYMEQYHKDFTYTEGTIVHLHSQEQWATLKTILDQNAKLPYAVIVPNDSEVEYALDEAGSDFGAIEYDTPKAV